MTTGKKLGVLRGVNFRRAIGASDWRVWLYMPDYGFRTWIFGKDNLPSIHKPNLFFVSSPYLKLHLIDSLLINLNYFLKVVHLKLDIVIVNDAFFWAGLLYKLLNPYSKLILDIRSIPVESKGIPGVISQFNFRLIMRIKAFDAISVITEGMLNDLDGQYHFLGKKPHVVWGSGYDEEVFMPHNNSRGQSKEVKLGKGFIVLFHGKLTNNRGLSSAIEALGVLKNMGMDDVRLVFVGEGDALPALKALSKRLNVESCVEFRPAIAYEQIPAIINQADMGIDPLPDHPWWRDQSPLKVFEYLAMGKPVIATDIPCHRNISAAVILISDNAPEKIALAIITYRKMPEAKKRLMKQQAQEEVKKMTWQNRSRIIADFILQRI